MVVTTVSQSSSYYTALLGPTLWYMWHQQTLWNITQDKDPIRRSLPGLKWWHSHIHSLSQTDAYKSAEVTIQAAVLSLCLVSVANVLPSSAPVGIWKTKLCRVVTIVPQFSSYDTALLGPTVTLCDTCESNTHTTWNIMPGRRPSKAVTIGSQIIALPYPLT